MSKIRIVSLIVLFTVAFAAAADAASQWDPSLTYEGNWIFLIDRLHQPKATPYRDDDLIPASTVQWGMAMQSDGEGEGYKSSPSWVGYWNTLGATKQYSGFTLSTKIAQWLDAGYANQGIRYTVREEKTANPVINNSEIVKLSYTTEYREKNMALLSFDDPWAGTDTNVAGVECVDYLNYGGELGPLTAKWDFYNTIYQTQTQLTRAWSGAVNVTIMNNQSERDVYWAFAKTATFDTNGLVTSVKPPTYQLVTVAEMNYPFTTRSVAGGANVEAHTAQGIDFTKYVKGSGYSARPTLYVDLGAQSGESYYNCVYTGGIWYQPSFIGGATYQLRFDQPYSEAGFPASSGSPFRWYDDYDLFLGGYIGADPGGYGVSGRYVTVRGRTIQISYTGGFVHEADIAAELRTYNPISNTDGPQTPYEWLYDASGDMYVPLTGYTPRPDITDPQIRRATELVAETMSWAPPIASNTTTNTPPNTTSKWWCWNTNNVTLWRWRTYDGRGSGSNRVNHPVYGGIDDNYSTGYDWLYNPTSLGAGGIRGVWYQVVALAGNLEGDDYNIGVNRDSGKIKDLYFEHAWKIAGIMLGDNFWDGGYLWSNELGAVATRIYTPDYFASLSTWNTYMPNWTWDGSAWVLPTAYGGATVTRHVVWGFVDGFYDVAVSGHDTLNDFMRYVFAIDAVVVEDVDGDGQFDVGEDYIMFSVTDDGLYKKHNYWTDPYGTTAKDTPFNGQFFNGDTIFLYDGRTVITYFDTRTGIFFGQPIGTTAGINSTLWAWGLDIDGLDLWIIPEPTSALLVLGTAFAFGAHIIRKRLGLKS